MQHDYSKCVKDKDRCTHYTNTGCELSRPGSYLKITMSNDTAEELTAEFKAKHPELVGQMEKIVAGYIESMNSLPCLQA